MPMPMPDHVAPLGLAASQHTRSPNTPDPPSSVPGLPGDCGVGLPAGEDPRVPLVCRGGAGAAGEPAAKRYYDERREVHAMLEIDMCGGGGGYRFITDLTDPALTKFEQQLVDE